MTTLVSDRRLMKDPLLPQQSNPNYEPLSYSAQPQSVNYHRNTLGSTRYTSSIHSNSGHNQVRFHVHPDVSPNANSNPILNVNAHSMSHGEARSNSPDSNTSSGQHNSKTGRRGDPRMHKAVAARLNDPNLTLFEALKIGGFEYVDDNNPNLVDSEKITLAQRKNQLSRRLRIARRHDNTAKYPTPTPSDNQNKFESLVEKQKQSFQLMQQTMEMERRNSGGGAGGANQFAATSLKRARSAPPKNGTEKSAGRSLLDDDEEEPEAKPAAQMMAKFHPQFQPFMVPPGLQYAQSAPFAGVTQPQPPNGVFFQPNPNFVVPNTAPLATPDAATGTLGATVNATAPVNNAANVSGVALRSLTNTAQSVGLTLEQLALALSSTRNLAEIVLGDKEPGSAEHKKKKQELALQLYQHEVRPVYARCMHLAGFKAESTAESSKEYLKFAWKAWQNEGRRLRDLLEENDMLVDEAPDFSEERSAKRLKSANSACEGQEQHVHDLDKCSHKPILHHPKDGESHIDFVVGDKVECYQGVSSQERPKWPSLISCDKCEHEHAPKETGSSGKAPRVLELKDLDLQGNEWNTDFDDTWSGLVRLGETGASDMSATSLAVENAMDV